MTKAISYAAFAGLLLGIAGCATPQQQAAQKEDLLAAAGFQVRVANTPQRIAALKHGEGQAGWYPSIGIKGQEFFDRQEANGILATYRDSFLP